MKILLMPIHNAINVDFKWLLRKSILNRYIEKLIFYFVSILISINITEMYLFVKLIIELIKNSSQKGKKVKRL